MKESEELKVLKDMVLISHIIDSVIFYIYKKNNKFYSEKSHNESEQEFKQEVIKLKEACEQFIKKYNVIPLQIRNPLILENMDFVDLTFNGKVVKLHGRFLEKELVNIVKSFKLSNNILTNVIDMI